MIVILCGAHRSVREVRCQSRAMGAPMQSRCQSWLAPLMRTPTQRLKSGGGAMATALHGRKSPHGSRCRVLEPVNRVRTGKERKKASGKNTNKANMGHCHPFILKFDISKIRRPAELLDCVPKIKIQTTTRKNKPDVHGKEGWHGWASSNTRGRAPSPQAAQTTREGNRVHPHKCTQKNTYTNYACACTRMHTQHERTCTQMCTPTHLPRHPHHTHASAHASLLTRS